MLEIFKEMLDLNKQKIQVVGKKNDNEIYLEAILSSSAIASLICASLLASASPILASLLTSAVRAIPSA